MNKQQLELGNELNVRIESLKGELSRIDKLIESNGRNKIYVSDYNHSVLLPKELSVKVLELVKKHYETELSQSEELFEKL